MRSVVTHSLRFVLLILLQVLVFNQLEIGFGIHVMVYPLFIMLLPFEISIVFMLFLAFGMGMIIDSISNTYGLHTSALLLVAYVRPVIFNLLSPREGYDNLKEANVFEMGQRWFILAFGSLLLIHHFWFFLIEVFKINDFFFTLRKLVLSAPISYVFCILLQFIFIKRGKTQ